MSNLKMSLSDSAQKFLIENKHVRGVIVHLTHSFKTILSQHTYPPIVQKYLGEVLLIAVMLAETIKLNGRLTIQFQSDSALKMLVAQINDEGHLRGLAQWDASAPMEKLEKGLGEGSLVMTIFQKHQEKPSQSIVPLENRSITEALTFYFAQSEQLPTQFALAVKDDMASGMMLQVLPENTDTKRDAQWAELSEKMQKLDARELFYDNNVSFLQYHFGEDDIRLFDSRDLKFHCGCSVDKMENAIYVMGQAEANLILKENASIVVTCEYCNHHYAFNKEEVEKLFDARRNVH